MNYTRINRTLIAISLLFITITSTIISFYFLLISKIDGTYTCQTYTYLDGGVSESKIIFKNNEIFHHLKEPNKVGLIEKIGTYKRTGFSTVLIDEGNLGFRFSATCGVIGLYIDEVDAKKLNMNFPSIGNIFYWRSIW